MRKADFNKSPPTIADSWKCRKLRPIWHFWVPFVFFFVLSFVWIDFLKKVYPKNHVYNIIKATDVIINVSTLVIFILSVVTIHREDKRAKLVRSLITTYMRLTNTIYSGLKYENLTTAASNKNERRFKEFQVITTLDGKGATNFPADNLLQEINLLIVGSLIATYWQMSSGYKLEEFEAGVFSKRVSDKDLSEQLDRMLMAMYSNNGKKISQFNWLRKKLIDDQEDVVGHSFLTSLSILMFSIKESKGTTEMDFNEMNKIIDTAAEKLRKISIYDQESSFYVNQTIFYVLGILYFAGLPFLLLQYSEEILLFLYPFIVLVVGGVFGYSIYVHNLFVNPTTRHAYYIHKDIWECSANAEVLLVRYIYQNKSDFEPRIHKTEALYRMFFV